MPIIRSAIKAMHQSRRRQARNQHFKSEMKSMMKLLVDYVKKGEKEKAQKVLPQVLSAIDKAYKKNLIHLNNARHKKSRVQTAVHKLLLAK